MKFEIRLDVNAHRDFDRHVAYFESRDDLRHRVSDFEDDLLATFDIISERPLLHREVYPGVRHEALRLFNYHVWFRTYEAAHFVDVFAILHQASDPSTVETRLR